MVKITREWILEERKRRNIFEYCPKSLTDKLISLVEQYDANYILMAKARKEFGTMSDEHRVYIAEERRLYELCKRTRQKLGIYCYLQGGGVVLSFTQANKPAELEEYNVETEIPNEQEY